MNTNLKFTFSIFVVFIYLFIATATDDTDPKFEDVELKVEKLVGQSYNIQQYIGEGTGYNPDSYIKIKFKTNSTYSIYQKGKMTGIGCGGEGTWSIKNNKVILGPNDSYCENVRDCKGEYESYYFNGIYNR